MNERALVSVVMQIAPREDVTLPLTTGNLVHACFLDQIVRPHDPALAKALRCHRYGAGSPSWIPPESPWPASRMHCV